MLSLIDNKINKILTFPGEDAKLWKRDLKRLQDGDLTLTRRSASESSIKAIQRLLIFLGYSTSSNGAFVVDGDFGRGTNRAVAQFQFEHKIDSNIKRSQLAYPASWQSARKNIVAIPEVRLTVKTIEKLLEETKANIASSQVMCGTFEEALFHLNGVHSRKFLTCREIQAKYGKLAVQASQQILADKNTRIHPAWILTFIKQETTGVVRPRFEQHILSRRNAKYPGISFPELRYQSMSFGLGQVMGFNFKAVQADSAMDMFTSPIDEQVLFISRFIAPKRDIVSKENPSDSDFHKIARFYNGPGYAKHHYHESLQRWFNEFKGLM